MSGADFSQAITAGYTEAVHWCRNLLLTPLGRAGKRFTAEHARMFRAYAESTAFEPIALKVASFPGLSGEGERPRDYCMRMRENYPKKW